MADTEEVWLENRLHADGHVTLLIIDCQYEFFYLKISTRGGNI